MSRDNVTLKFLLTFKAVFSRMRYMDISRTLHKLERVLLFLTFFLFPLVFMPLFPNFFATPKLILLAVVVGLTLIIKAVKIIATRKMSIYSSVFDSALYLLVLAYLLSVLVVSPNKVEALIDPNRGVLLVVFLTVLVFALPKDKKVVLWASTAAMAVLFVSTILGYFTLFGFLPESWQFINMKGFNPMGNLISQALYGAFFLALVLDSLKDRVAAKEVQMSGKSNKGLLNVLFIVALLTTVLSAFMLLKDVRPVFLPLANAWAITVDVLKTGRTALFGVGPANYVTLFTRSKPLSVNALPDLWNVNVEFTRGAALQIFSEVGLVGLLALIMIFVHLYYAAKRFNTVLSFTVLVIWALFFPLSQIFFFLLFLAVFLNREDKEVREFDLRGLDLFAYGSAAAILAVTVGTGYFFGRAMASEYVLNASFNAVRENKAQLVYDLQRQASILNPYNERARSNFSQTNLLLASNIAQKEKLTDEDRQVITTLIQQAISEAKALVASNPQKAVFWAHLAETYRNLLGIAEGAEEWTISSYQRAVALDPRNPSYYFALGSVYYALGNFDEAIGFFGQAISLKPDMANYYYNIAWAYYQKEDYPAAVGSLETVLRLIEDKKSDDYKKASKELEEFKAKLPVEEATEGGEELQPETLVQPSPLPTGEAEIRLPKESAPPSITITPAPTGR